MAIPSDKPVYYNLTLDKDNKASFQKVKKEEAMSAETLLTQINKYLSNGTQFDCPLEKVSEIAQQVISQYDKKIESYWAPYRFIVKHWASDEINTVHNLYLNTHRLKVDRTAADAAVVKEMRNYGFKGDDPNRAREYRKYFLHWCNNTLLLHSQSTNDLSQFEESLKNLKLDKFAPFYGDKYNKNLDMFFSYLMTLRQIEEPNIEYMLSVTHTKLEDDYLKNGASLKAIQFMIIIGHVCQLSNMARIIDPEIANKYTGTDPGVKEFLLKNIENSKKRKML